jgi:RNA polymerase sigma-70 factor (ECF subfamily)
LNTDSDDIHDIIEGCKKNDRRAQERFYRKFYKPMAGICLRYTKDQADVTSVLNTGFLKVFKNIAQYDHNKAAVYTWVKRIIINTCLDHLKANKNNIEKIELDDASHLAQESAMDAKINLNELLHLVKKLPTATQAVFNLFIIDNYSHKEIAHLLNISEGTSKWHLNEARNKLKIHLQKMYIVE